MNIKVTAFTESKNFSYTDVIHEGLDGGGGGGGLVFTIH